MQNIPEHQNLKASSMPVDSLESLIGLDLFHNLNDAVEDEVEAQVVKKHWGTPMSLFLYNFPYHNSAFGLYF